MHLFEKKKAKHFIAFKMNIKTVFYNFNLFFISLKKSKNFIVFYLKNIKIT